MANPLGDPIPVDDTSTEDVEQEDEYGTCPECGGRGNPCGSTATKEFLKCEYCGENFSEAI